MSVKLFVIVIIEFKRYPSTNCLMQIDLKIRNLFKSLGNMISLRKK